MRGPGRRFTTKVTKVREGNRTDESLVILRVLSGSRAWSSRLHPVGVFYAGGYASRITQKITPAAAAEAGIVMIHAQTIRRATPQRTADSRWIAPTPIIAPVIVCVVLTGIPAKPCRTA